jgi:cellulose synthase/poly-beta-1,6-N-acetylglucosamine synthase-like glycosyltransferase
MMAALLLLPVLTTATAMTAAATVRPPAAGSTVLPPGGGALDPLTGNRSTPADPTTTTRDPLTVNQNRPGPSWLAWIGIALLVLLSLAMTAVAATTIGWMLHAWRSPDHLQATKFSGRPQTGRPIRFSLMVPARHEEEVLGQTLDQLAALDYVDVEVLAIIGHDDPGTEAVARQAAARHPERIRVVIDHSVPKNKPKALNTALAHARGDVVGVMDAEDEVHPQLLTHIAARFHETGADVVQGGVQLMNIHSSWWSLRNCLEYYFWFRSRLHFHAGARFIPLGGNTVFIRTAQLREVDGWDDGCLAEDCEIGVRLSTRGAKVAVAYDPELVTREETPGSLASLIKQRTRWNQGFLQVLRKGIWRDLPTRRQRLLARYTLSMPFLQAFTGLMIPVSIALTLFAKVPTWVSLISFLPLVPTLITLAVESAGLDEFGRVYGVKVRARDHVKLLLGTFPYQVLLAGAAVRAVIRDRRADFSWEKTEHTNAHREPAVIDLTAGQYATTASTGSRS